MFIFPFHEILIPQIYEMCRADFRFHMLENVHLMHRQIHTRARTKQLVTANSEFYRKNGKLYKRFTRELDANYPNEEVRLYCDETDVWPDFSDINRFLNTTLVR